MLAPWKESYDKPRQHIQKQRHHFTNKDLYSQNYGFFSSHVQMWELDHKEGLALKSWCLQIVVLEKTHETLGLQGDQTSQFWRKSTLNIHWKDCCWSWSSYTLATWCEDPLEKTPMLGKTEGKRRGRQRLRWLESITDSVDVSLI